MKSVRTTPWTSRIYFGGINFPPSRGNACDGLPRCRPIRYRLVLDAAPMHASRIRAYEHQTWRCFPTRHMFTTCSKLMARWVPFGRKPKPHKYEVDRTATIYPTSRDETQRRAICLMLLRILCVDEGRSTRTKLMYPHSIFESFND